MAEPIELGGTDKKFDADFPPLSRPPIHSEDCTDCSNLLLHIHDPHPKPKFKALTCRNCHKILGYLEAWNQQPWAWCWNCKIKWENTHASAVNTHEDGGDG